MKFRITEEERKNIMDKYSENYNQNILTYLKRNFPVWSSGEIEWLKKPIKFIQINGKSKTLDSNKSFLVNAIANTIEEEFPNESEDVIRRTIKYYIDIMRIES
jgi:hypothetical protein